MLRAVTVSAPRVEGGEIDDKQGRSFEAVLVASIERLGEKAPLLAVFAVTEGQFKPFWANLRTGADVELSALTDTLPNHYGRRGNQGPTLTFPSKEPLIWVPTQRTTKGHLMQIYNARWFHFASGRVEGQIEFCMCPRVDKLHAEQERAGKQRKSVEQHFRKLAYLFDESQEERKNDYGYYGRGYKVTKEGFDEQAAYCKPYRDLRDDSTMWDCLEARSELLCAFLLQRSGLPMPEDVRFFAQVWVGMRATKALLNANEDRNTTVRGLDNPDLGLTQPWFVSVRTETLRDFLAAEVRFFEKAISMDDVPDPAREPKKIPRMDDDEGDDDSDVEDEDE